MNSYRCDLRSLALVLITLPFWTGCDGCRRVDSDDKKKQAGKTIVPVEEFTFGQASPLPSGGASPVTGVKPGHWFTLRQAVRSNKIDRRGDLTLGTFVNDSASTTTNATPGSSVTCTRPAVLPKGRMKRLDVRLLASDSAIEASKRISTGGTFQSESSLAESNRTDHNVMRSDEYFFAILTTRPERFATFQVADWVQAPTDGESTGLAKKNYRIVFPRSPGLLSLPETMLDWTSTAVLFWDDVSPSELTAEQRTALIDWLHFGGRMIVNGGSNATEFTTGELGPLLPISVDGMVALDADSLAELIEQSSVQKDDSKSAVITLVREQSNRVSIGGQLAKDAIPVPRTGDLLATRRVGRGEIVMSRFDLTSDWMIGWRSRDSFFNATVLSRPGRRYDQEEMLVQRYITDSDVSQVNAAINTSLRLVSRDARVPYTNLGVSSQVVSQNEPTTASSDEFASHPVTGVGGWKDDSDVGSMLKSVLRDKAGITIPTVPFVMKSLGMYLALLVPVNYFVFRILGRLEWAWLAVPAIGLAGAAWVARAVSLDLGLARNRSEIALLELQPGYSRGHLTRYGSIYNSLSGTYRMDFDSPDAAIYPVELESSEPLLGSSPVLRFGYSAGLSLDNFTVPSNRARLFHAEQIVDVGGPISLIGDSLINGTSKTIIDAVVARKSMDGQIEYAGINSVAPTGKFALKWAKYMGAIESLPMAEVLLRTSWMPKGTVRLVGRMEQPFEGMTVQPEAPVQSVTNIVFANLTYPPKEFSPGDVNLMPKRKKQDSIILEGVEKSPPLEESSQP